MWVHHEKTFRTGKKATDTFVITPHLSCAIGCYYNSGAWKDVLLVLQGTAVRGCFFSVCFYFIIIIIFSMRLSHSFGCICCCFVSGILLHLKLWQTGKQKRRNVSVVYSDLSSTHLDSHVPAL